ncbi:anaerobic ribonucleoside-triphosphate reductase activating protein [Halomonas sp. LBP4]|uniref:anaerobic ribonucleoside-triphosphate reductase activating protein n=1 Tax=Halomonas sp. LBP4 TaxID=2044917 RepID=UPI000D7726D6|nr:anaerobic ribonucleoside-triphosphate reductase activating protein [Halomonas sp. LBP4]PXX96398.1 anaerobic ribonucleoside-triphosphate reductase activating protein [Halomonas sp. LBP4]
MPSSRLHLPVAGLTPMTTLDYPGHLACVVFLQGCPLRCGYCHNPQMLAPRRGDPQEWQAVRDFLARRRSLLEAVVFSGGEPTQHPDLPAAIAQASAMGFKVGLHTAGVYPHRLAELLPWLDWVGLDVKGDAEAFDRICGRPGLQAAHGRSLALLLANGVDLECRTTVHWRDFDLAAVKRLALSLAECGVTRYALQIARPGQSLDGAYAAPVPGAPGMAALDALVESLRPAFESLILRR